MNTQETTQESSPATTQSTQANAPAAVQTNTSTLYLNRIRLYAAFLVVVIHVSTLFFYVTPIYSMVWKISAFYDGLARIAVPLFIFVSGAIYLNENKKVTYKKILLTILRFIVIFFIWDIFYHVFDLFVREKQALNLTTLKTLFFSLIQYKYHLWYLLAYIALLALSPVLKLICKRENRSQVRYLLIIFVAGTCLFEAFAYLVNAVNATSALYNVFKYLVNVTALANFGKFFSLIILYLSGWYFSTFDFSKYKKAIYWCFGIGTLLLPIVGIFICVLLNNHNLIAFIENYYYFPCYFLTVTTFLAFRYSKIANTPNKFVDYLCKQTFGIYLIHVLFVDYVETIYFSCLTTAILNSRWMLLIHFASFVIVFALSLGTSIILNLLPPKIKKWIC